MLFIDVETTGLPPRDAVPSPDIWPHVVSISWAIFQSADTRLVHRSFVIKPKGFIVPSESTRIHGITHQYATKNGQPLKTVLRAISDDIAKRTPSRIIAYNLDFDLGMMSVSFQRGSVANPLEDLKQICAMRFAASSLGSGWMKLQDLHMELFGKAYERAHSASADVLACARCFFELSERKVENDLGSSTSIHAQELIDRILDWASDRPEFDTGYVDNLSEQLNSRGSLSERQIGALENIVSKWRVP